MKKSLLIFIALLLAAQLTACGGETATTETTDTTPAITEPVETEPEGPQLEVSKSDYEGYKVTFLTVENYTDNFKLVEEEGSGDVLIDAAYKRNLAVTELLNVGFASHEVGSEEVASTLAADVMAGGASYDFVFPHASAGVPAMVVDGVLQDWNAVNHVNMENPWWNSNMGETLSIGGKLFYASGDITMTWQGMGAIVFNKDYIADYNLDTDMYEYVYDGTWTVDKMLNIAKEMYVDLDGDGETSDKDQYGMLLNRYGIWYQFGFNQPISRINENGVPVLDMGTERMFKVVEKYYEMMYAPYTYTESVYSSAYPTSVYRDILISGRTFLTSFDLGGLYSYLREIEFEVGILPMPKLDEAQDGYYAMCGAGIIGIPKLAPDLNRTGKVAEALAYYSYDILRPAFFDTVLQSKVLRDEESYNMLTMMHENKVFDFGINFDGTASGALDAVVLNKKSTDFASHYASIESKVNNTFQKMYDAVMEAES